MKSFGLKTFQMRMTALLNNLLDDYPEMVPNLGKLIISKYVLSNDENRLALLPSI